MKHEICDSIFSVNKVNKVSFLQKREEMLRWCNSLMIYPVYHMLVIFQIYLAL